MFLQHKTRYKPPSEFIIFMLFPKLNLFLVFSRLVSSSRNIRRFVGSVRRDQEYK